MGYVWRGTKSNPRPQEFYRAGTAPPGFEIPGSATDVDRENYLMWANTERCVKVSASLTLSFKNW